MSEDGVCLRQGWAECHLEGGGEMLSIDEMKGGNYIWQGDTSSGSTTDCSLPKSRAEVNTGGQKEQPRTEELWWFLKRETNLCTDTQTSSMRALVFLPLLLCAVASVEQVRAEVNTVKLCGREFLRAVVYTCGGSRWRRFLTESDMEGLPTGEQSSLESLSNSLSSLGSGSSSSSSSLGAELTRRDINNMLTTVCCQVGCRKSDLTFLC